MLQKEDYIRTVRRPYPPFWASLILRGIAEADYYDPFVAGRFAMHNLIKTHEVWYYARRELAAAGRVAFEYWRQPGVLARVEGLFEQRAQELLAAAEAGTDLAELADLYGRYMPALILVFGADRPVAEAAEKALKERLPTGEARELLDRLNVPLKDNYYKQEEYELALTDDIEQHVRKYGWLYSRYGEDKPYTVEQAAQRREEIDKDQLLAERARTKAATEQAVGQAKAVLGEAAYLVDLLQFVIYYRTQRTDVINRVSYVYITKMRQIASAMGLDYSQLLHVTLAEAVDSLPGADVIAERQRDHVMLLEDGRVRCAHGEERTRIAHFLREDASDVRELVGTVACRGRAVGAARLVFNSSDMSRVRAGDILVTSMTTPEMVPAMNARRRLSRMKAASRATRLSWRGRWTSRVLLARGWLRRCFKMEISWRWMPIRES